MAKKRQRKKVYKPPTPRLETSFNCPECGRKKVVEVHFNKRDNKGLLKCRACGEEYEGKLKRASMPIDVYYDWINHRDQEKEKENECENGKKEEGTEEIEEGDENENNEVEEQQDNSEGNDYDGGQEEQNQEKDEDEDEDEADGDYNEEEGSNY